jgi:hypothetical protein
MILNSMSGGIEKLQDGPVRFGLLGLFDRRTLYVGRFASLFAVLTAALTLVVVVTLPFFAEASLLAFFGWLLMTFIGWPVGLFVGLRRWSERCAPKQ